MELSSNLTWTHHVNKTVKKANTTLGFLRRNLRVSNEKTKEAAYFSLVRPAAEYCSTVWNPHTKDLTQSVEMVQRRAARYVTNRFHNTSSVTDMIQHLQWESLESRRIKSQLTMMYKITNNLVDIPADQYLTLAPTRIRANHQKKLRTIQTTTTTYKNSFFPRTIPIWNSLPGSIAEASDLASFKQGLSSLTF